MMDGIHTLLDSLKAAPTGFAARLERCRGGETIELGKAVFAPERIRGYRFAKPVRILGGSFTGLDLRDCAGLSFEMTQLRCNDENITHRVNGCDRIRMRGLELFGPTDSAVGQREGLGLFFDQTTNWAVEHADVHHLRHGIAHRRADRGRVADSRFHDLRTDGLRGSGSSGLRIENNDFWNFFPPATGGRSDHPDAIQFWNEATHRSHDIHIRGNRIWRGAGHPVQGIFLRGNYQPARLRFTGTRIENNIVVGGLYNGIALSAADDATIGGNRIIPLGEQKSWLRLDDVNGTIIGNRATFLGDRPRGNRDQSAMNAADAMRIVEAWRSGEAASPPGRPQASG